MRIAILMNVKSPWARNTAAQLAELGADVHVLDFGTRGRQPEYLAEQIDKQQAEMAAFRRQVRAIHLLRSAFSSEIRYLTCAGDVRRICEQVGADILITLYGGGSGLMAWGSGFRPYAVYVVGSDVLLVTGWRARLSRFVLEKASLVLANGEYLAGKARELAPHANVSALYLGVDLDTFRPVERTGSSGARLLSTRGFLPVYNNESIIRALAMIDGDSLSEMVFVSSGPFLPAARALAGTVLPEPTRSKTKFLGGADKNTLLSLVRLCDVYVSMSRSDGTSTSLLEALACGAFPVVSDIPANREWIDTMANGILVPLDDDRELAAALSHAMEDPELRQSAAAQNRWLVETRADTRKTMSKLLDYCHEVVAGIPPAAKIA
jgi:glycosyltransferase involved in cell wall biosynthesis